MYPYFLLQAIPSINRLWRLKPRNTFEIEKTKWMPIMVMDLHLKVNWHQWRYCIKNFNNDISGLTCPFWWVGYNNCNLRYFEAQNYFILYYLLMLFSFHFHFLSISMICLLNTKGECIFINFSVLLYFSLASFIIIVHAFVYFSVNRGLNQYL